MIALIYLVPQGNGTYTTQLAVDFTDNLNFFINRNNDKNWCLVYEDEDTFVCFEDGSKYSVFHYEKNDTSEIRIPLENILMKSNIEYSNPTLKCSELDLSSMNERTIHTSTLQVPKLQQPNNVTCWATCTASIGNYKTGKSYAPLDVASLSGYTPNEGVHISNIPGIMTTVYGISPSYFDLKLTYRYVYNNIHNNSPIYARFEYLSGSAHAIVVNGYYYNDNTANYSYSCMDPLSPGAYRSAYAPDSTGTITYVTASGSACTQVSFVSFY